MFLTTNCEQIVKLQVEQLFCPKVCVCGGGGGGGQKPNGGIIKLCARFCFEKGGGRQESGKGGGEGRVSSLMSIPSDVTQCQFSNVTFHLYQKMTSQFIYT